MNRKRATRQRGTETKTGEAACADVGQHMRRAFALATVVYRRCCRGRMYGQLFGEVVDMVRKCELLCQKQLNCQPDRQQAALRKPHGEATCDEQPAHIPRRSNATSLSLKPRAMQGVVHAHAPARDLDSG